MSHKNVYADSRWVNRRMLHIIMCLHSSLTERIVVRLSYARAAAVEDLAKEIDVQLSVLPAEQSVHNGVDGCADHGETNSPK